MALAAAADLIQGGSAMASPFWSYAGLAGGAVAVSAAILAFLYVWGQLFRSSPLVSYVKLEIYELVVSAVLVLFIFGAIEALEELSIEGLLPQNLLPEEYPAGSGSNQNIYTMSEGYFKRVASDMESWLQLNYMLGMYVDQLASLTVNARPLGLGLVASPFSGFGSPFKQLIYNMSVALSIAYVINYAQLYVFLFCIQAFLNYYLPIGVFLRCFTPTRRLGGAIIALAVTFLIALPVFISFNSAILYNSDSGPLITFRGFLTDYLDNDQGFKSATNDFFKEFKSVGGVLDLVSGGLNALAVVFKKLVGGTFLALILIPVSIVGWAFVMGYILPTFTILLLVQAAKYLGKTFGEEIDISSLTRLI